MNQPIPTGPDLFAFAESFAQKAKYVDGFDGPEQDYYLRMAALYAQQAQTAATVMLAEITATGAGVDHADLDAWRRKIGLSWLTECKSRTWRRPQCEERHTEGCRYAEPAPEPKHVLLPVGTRVLVSDWVSEENEFDGGWTARLKNPQAGRISGYDLRKSKYRWQREYEPGRYATHDSWAYADNRVQVHPDGPECPAGPKPVKQEPTGPRIYVRNVRGKQGYIIGTEVTEKGDRWLVVRWLEPGCPQERLNIRLVALIADSEVERCPHGQTRDECASGENRCELCLQAEDDEAADIEESMGLR